MANHPNITITGRRIAADEAPYVIADMPANHDGNIETAFKIIEVAKRAGPDAVKLQTYRPDAIPCTCVSGYPTPAEDYNLRTIPDMIQRFGLVTGLSDHTLDNTTAITSVDMGACVIEKHFTLDRSGGGPDDSFSLEHPELAALCLGVRTAWEALRKVDYGRKSSETGNVKYRRSLYFVRDMKAGDVITADTVSSVRRGFGLAPKYMEHMFGESAKQDVKRGTALAWELL